ncbi:putative ATP-dependent helicase [Diplodia seriata]|uniref:Putative ATP-dependent helicase n=1 Tax=Diplodia seriata TaxID=420778 RepID=A0A1S8B669_9PEZI|nr:putative ATP-dependent helicase [Diplodia seriata]
MDYDVIITSYAFVMAQHRKRVNFIQKIRKFQQNGTGLPPSRPNLSLFSEIFRWGNIKAPYLVLDEVNAIKNPRSLTFSAIEELRSLADTCVMLTGSPLDNTWQDLFAFLQLLEGHNIRQKRKMLYLLGTPDTKRPGRFRPPTAQRFLRLIQIMNGFMVRRPDTTMDLPPLVEIPVTFTLDGTEAAASNAEYEKYKRALRSKALDNVHGAASRGAKTSALPAEDSKGLQFLHLTRALQYACHPQLVQIMRFARIKHATGLHDDSAAADMLEDPAAIAEWTSWRETIRQDDNWMSSRVTAVIDSFNRRRDIDPACSVIIFDESVYFLDIIEIAFAAMYEPVSCLRYDGRQAPDKRDRILEEFKMAAGSKVLLMSRATGGLGLNITSANVVILCSPWWKKEWEIQALKRVHRTGQERTVHLITISAVNCDAELYKAKTRDRKHEFNSKVVSAITRRDDEAPRVWDNFR